MTLIKYDRMHPASALTAHFAHGQAFDAIKLNLGFGSKEACITLDFRSEYCAFREMFQFFEKVSAFPGNHEFGWDAEGTRSHFAWERDNNRDTGLLTATRDDGSVILSQTVRLDGDTAALTVYRAFRQFVESDAYDPMRYEALTLGESIRLTLKDGDFARLPAKLAEMNAVSVNVFLNKANGGPDGRDISGCNERYSLESILGSIGKLETDKEILEAILGTRMWMTAEWDEWTKARRKTEIFEIMKGDAGKWHGENLRELWFPWFDSRLSNGYLR